jgi:hypothetical protein
MILMNCNVENTIFLPEYIYSFINKRIGNVIDLSDPLFSANHELRDLRKQILGAVSVKLSDKRRNEIKGKNVKPTTIILNSRILKFHNNLINTIIFKWFKQEFLFWILYSKKEKIRARIYEFMNVYQINEIHYISLKKIYYKQKEKYVLQ